MLRLLQKGENKGESSQYTYSIGTLLRRRENKSAQQNLINIILKNTSIKQSNEDPIYRQKCTEKASVQIPAARFYFPFFKVEHR